MSSEEKARFLFVQVLRKFYLGLLYAVPLFIGKF